MALNVIVAFTLLIASALLGLAIGLVFRFGAIAPVSLLIAIVSAPILRAHDFEFAGGVSVVIGCLVICQATYLTGAFMTTRSLSAANLTREEVDGEPSGDREQDVGDEDK